MIAFKVFKLYMENDIYFESIQSSYKTINNFESVINCNCGIKSAWTSISMN